MSKEQEELEFLVSTTNDFLAHAEEDFYEIGKFSELKEILDQKVRDLESRQSKCARL